MRFLEHNDQVDVIDFIRENYGIAPQNPNGVLVNGSSGGARFGRGKQAMLRGMRQKQAGASKGFPDIFIYEQDTKKIYNGLAIEMKREKGGHVDPEQTAWLSELNKRGFKAVICRGKESAQNEIMDYLGPFRLQKGLI